MILALKNPGHTYDEHMILALKLGVTTCHQVFGAKESIESEGIITKTGTCPLLPNPNENWWLKAWIVDKLDWGVLVDHVVAFPYKKDTPSHQIEPPHLAKPPPSPRRFHRQSTVKLSRPKLEPEEHQSTHLAEASPSWAAQISHVICSLPPLLVVSKMRSRSSCDDVGSNHVKKWAY
jgi:hypothetical protein